MVYKTNHKRMVNYPSSAQGKAELNRIFLIRHWQIKGSDKFVRFPSRSTYSTLIWMRFYSHECKQPDSSTHHRNYAKNYAFHRVYTLNWAVWIGQLNFIQKLNQQWQWTWGWESNTYLKKKIVTRKVMLCFFVMNYELWKSGIIFYAFFKLWNEFFRILMNVWQMHIFEISFASTLHEISEIFVNYANGRGRQFSVFGILNFNCEIIRAFKICII